MRRVEDDQRSLVGILNRVQGWTIAADQKISVVTAIQAIVCGFLFQELRDWIKNEHTSVLITVAVLSGLPLLAAAVVTTLYALSPTITGTAHKSATVFGTTDTWSLDFCRRHLASMD